MNKRIYIIIFSIFVGIISCAARSVSPILVLATNSNFGLYTGEILKTEGFNEYELDSMSDPSVNLKYLKQFDVVILSQTSVTPAQKEMMASYVKDGGNLIAFRPDKKLSDIFGINDAGGTISEGYIAVNKNSVEAKKITPESMQFHGTADKYKLAKGKLIASLFSDANTNSGLPAVVSNNYGKGHAVAFLYNLPQSIVYTRQGNPQNAGIEKDGINGLRAMDLFTDGWVNTSKNTINQADEQMRLLSHCIEKMNSYTKPLPRLWYFPDNLKCLATLTNDGEGQGETDFEPQFADVDSKGAKMTIYLLAINKTSKAFVDKWAGRGHEMVGHPDDTKEAPNPHWNRMDSVIAGKKNEVLTKYGITQHTNVNHWFVWCGRHADGTPDFTAEAKLEAKNGIEMDVNYAHYDGGSNQGRFLGPLGYICNCIINPFDEILSIISTCTNRLIINCNINSGCMRNVSFRIHPSCTQPPTSQELLSSSQYNGNSQFSSPGFSSHDLTIANKFNFAGQFFHCGPLYINLYISLPFNLNFISRAIASVDF